MQSETINLSVMGMTCGGCAAKVNRALGQITDVQTVNVNPVTDRATVRFKDAASREQIEQLISTVEQVGYQASLFTRKSGEESAEGITAHKDIILLVASIFVALPMLAQMISMPFTNKMFISGEFQLLLASFIQFGIGLKYYKSAARALKSLSGSMDLLIVTGTSAAFGYSLYQLLVQPHAPHLFFEASSIVIVMVAIGKQLEERAKKRATADLRDLMDLQPKSACLLTENGELDIPVEDVVPGNMIVVRPGGTIPVDGVIRSGNSDINEAMLTGESLPVTKSEGMQVKAGSINETGLLHFEATAIGEDTTLASIVRLVEAAQSGKASIQRLVDRISAVFVPLIIVIAIVTFAAWLLLAGDFEQALLAAVSVLVIACPCALGLATPTALVVGTGAAAKSGIVISDIDAIEKMTKIDLVAFDKTGTLTKGHLHISDINCVEMDERKLVQLVASAQQGSEHFLGKAIVDYAKKLQIDLLPVSDFKATPGRGIEAIVDGVKIMSGNENFMAEAGVDLAEISRLNQELVQQSKSLAYVALDDRLTAVIAFEDELHEEAKAVVESLHRSGKSVLMLTGDNQQTAGKVADILGLDEYYAALSPEQKVEKVKQLEQVGTSVMMVGDGINDAPALAMASVGVAIGQGADMARSAATVTLLRPDLRLVAATMDVTLKIKRKIQENLFWAFIFNIIGIPLAAFGLLNPVIAGSAMALSSLAVMSNSLLLRKWTARNTGETA